MEPLRAAARPAARDRVRRAAADLDRAPQSQPLRPLRSAHAGHARGTLRSAGRHAARATAVSCGQPAFVGSRNSTGGRSAQSSSVPITLTPAHHFSARGPFDRNRALWGGFMLTADRARIYFAGDTAYAPFFHDIRQRLGPDRPGAAPDWRVRASLVHAERAHESGRGGAGAPRPRRDARASPCTSAHSR